MVKQESNMKDSDDNEVLFESHELCYKMYVNSSDSIFWFINLLATSKLNGSTSICRIPTFCPGFYHWDPIVEPYVIERYKFFLSGRGEKPSPVWLTESGGEHAMDIFNIIKDYCDEQQDKGEDESGK